MRLGRSSGRGTRILAAAAAFALGGACGGGLSKDEFAARAGELCARANERFRNVEVPSSADGLRSLLDEAEEVMNGLVRDLRALEPPAAGSELVEDMIDGFERAGELLPRLARAAASGDAAAIQSAAPELVGATADANRAAAEYGIEECSSGPITQLGR